MVSLLDGAGAVTLFFKRGNCVERVFFIAPVYGLGRAQGSFSNVFVGWTGGNPAQDDLFNPVAIGSSKDGTYVIQAAHVVKNDDNRSLFTGLELLFIQPLQLVIQRFSHAIIL